MNASLFKGVETYLKQAYVDKRKELPRLAARRSTSTQRSHDERGQMSPTLGLSSEVDAAEIYGIDKRKSNALPARFDSALKRSDLTLKRARSGVSIF
jgi:hypothetical protein